MQPLPISSMLNGTTYKNSKNCVLIHTRDAQNDACAGSTLVMLKIFLKYFKFLFSISKIISGTSYIVLESSVFFFTFHKSTTNTSHTSSEPFLHHSHYDDDQHLETKMPNVVVREATAARVFDRELRRLVDNGCTFT